VHLERDFVARLVWQPLQWPFSGPITHSAQRSNVATDKVGYAFLSPVANSNLSSFERQEISLYEESSTKIAVTNDFKDGVMV
jgi:hypothetical protein